MPTAQQGVNDVVFGIRRYRDEITQLPRTYKKPNSWLNAVAADYG